MITTPISSLSMQDDDDGDISVLYTINKHFGCVNSILCFDGSQKKIVTCSSDKTIRVWDSRKGSNLKVFKTHNAGIRKLLKWGKDGFLSSSDDGSVQYFSVSDYSVHKTIVQVKSNLYNLLRLTYDLLLVVTGSHEMLVVSFSKRKVLKIIEEKTSPRTCPILSRDKSKQGYFYVNSDVENSPVLLFNANDLSNIRTERVFNDHTGNVCSLSSLVVQNETLLCSGGSSVVYMYNTSVNEDDLNYLRRISLTFDVTCLRTVLNRYILTGDEMGNFHIFDSRQGLGNIGTIQLHKKDIQDIAILSLQTGSCLTFVCCSKDRTIKVVSLGDRKIESFDKIRHEQTKIRYVRNTKNRKSPPKSFKNSEGQERKAKKTPPRKKVKSRKKSRKKKRTKLRMFSFFNDDEDHEMYKAEGGDPLKEAEKFIDRTRRIISPNKYREEEKKEKREEDEDDFIFFEDTTDDDEEIDDRSKNAKDAIVPRVTSVSFFNPPTKKRFGF